MSQQLINRSPDLKKLQDDGYEIAIKAGHLAIPNVPYVNSKGQVRLGTLVSQLDLAGDVTAKPGTHVTMFAGGHPCDAHGRELEKIKNTSSRQEIYDDLVVDHVFSAKPAGGYADYHEKMTTYIAIISSPAKSIDPNVTATTRRVVESSDENSVFNYLDTASSRAGISYVSQKLELNNVTILGLGGSGAYVLDLVAKTPVRNIHTFDGDVFLQHNAFRGPGAPTIDKLRQVPMKVDYWADQYAPMRKGIITYPYNIDESNVDELREMDFVFLCIDGGKAKRPIIEKLEEFGIPFIDVGMGVELVDNQLHGIVRVTTSTPDKREHVRDKKRIGLTGNGEDDVYSRNIQIADLNALNAAFAVVRWKKLMGFYRDLEEEHFSAYTLDGNHITNEDQ